MVKLNSKVKDTITGFSGIATARSIYATGCIQILVTSKKLKDGEPNEIWIDESRLDVTSTPPGGPQNTPPRRNQPR